MVERAGGGEPLSGGQSFEEISPNQRTSLTRTSLSARALSASFVVTRTTGWRGRRLLSAIKLVQDGLRASHSMTTIEAAALAVTLSKSDQR